MRVPFPGEAAFFVGIFARKNVVLILLMPSYVQINDLEAQKTENKSNCRFLRNRTFF